MPLLRTPRLPIQLRHLLYVDLALAPATVLFVELTSRKWYTIIRSMAAEPRKMASVYRSLSEIILASFVRRLMGRLTGEIEERRGESSCSQSSSDRALELLVVRLSHLRRLRRRCGMRCVGANETDGPEIELAYVASWSSRDCCCRWSCPLEPQGG